MINLEKTNKKNEQVKEVRMKDYVKEVQGDMQVIDTNAFLSDVLKMFRH